MLRCTKIQHTTIWKTDVHFGKYVWRFLPCTFSLLPILMPHIEITQLLKWTHKILVFIVMAVYGCEAVAVP